MRPAGKRANPTLRCLLTEAEQERYRKGKIVVVATRGLRRRASRLLIVGLWGAVLTGFAGATRPAQADTEVARGGMAATVHPLATEAAVEAIEAGGNAVDAAVAAALMLGVVDPHNSGIGGGCFILVRRADGHVLAIDGRETAPAKATPDMFLREGKADPRLSQTGPLAVATPGALAAYARVVDRYGRLPLERSLRRAAARARQGFTATPVFASRLRPTAPLLRRFPESRRVFLKPDGRPFAAGERVSYPDLARTYEAIAEHGIAWFYQGPFAQRVGRWMAEHGGVLTAEDFAAYRPVDRQPIRTSYRSYEIVGFPPPSSGGVHVAQILNMLEAYDLRKLNDRDPALMAHVVLEAMKRAFADRAYWLGDPDQAKVPRGLIDKAYARALGRSIRLDRATPVERHGNPPRADRDWFAAPSGSRHTTHLTVVDGEGTWVAITQTINTSYGSKVVVPGTGVVLNNEMDDFAIAPGVPNAFGLVGAEANAVSAGKRPLSSMSPTLVLEDGRPILTAGAAGGPKIITQVVLTLIRFLDLKLPLEEAVGRPRYHHQWKPDRVVVEARADDALVRRLEALGHRVVRSASGGVTQAIAWRSGAGGKGEFVGVADPRASGKAQGWPRPGPSDSNRRRDAKSVSPRGGDRSEPEGASSAR